MAQSRNVTAKSEPRRPGRPAVNAVPVNVRFPPAELAALDAWMIKERVMILTRAQAVRLLVAKGMGK